ncbi:MAG: VWA domain-containing protein [Bacteroidia bacterium]|nr:VWA domain-containing protein [Bacteroidia bacterium]
MDSIEGACAHPLAEEPSSRTGMSLAWSAPEWLLLLPVWGVGGWLVTRLRLRTSYLGKGERAGWLKAYFSSLSVVGMLCFATVALARPVLSFSRSCYTLTPLWVLWDVSRSMKNRDILPDRQTYALERFLAWVDSVEERKVRTRLGIIVFAQTAYPFLPLTDDYEAFRFALRQASRLDIGEGTDLAAALRVASALAEAGQSCLVVSDGAHNVPGTPSLEALAQAAGQRGLKIHAFLVGRSQEQLFPTALQRITQLSQGQYYENQLPLFPFLQITPSCEQHYPLEGLLLLFAAILGLLALTTMAVWGWFNVMAP